MNPKQICLLLVGFLLLFALVGCGKKASFTNPPAVETSLAGTARALAKLTETARPVTPTVAVTPTITFTPTPKVSVNGTSLMVQADGSTVFVDQKAGIQLTVPPGWMAFRVGEQEYYDAFTSKVVLSSPALNERLTQIQDFDLEKFRLDAFDIREDHIPNGIISDMSVVFHEGDTRSLELWARAEGNQKSPYKNYRFLSGRYLKTADGTTVLAVEQTWSFDPSNKVFHRAVYFSLPTGTLVLNFYTNNAFKDTVRPEFDQFVNSVTPLNP
jgi:hypothetical protein